ncbi:unnamed protein product [Haemonchus placei]|uniref:MACPF domain-containing protein n=1 Tax=Haemonchus placei TaxID=6290 RepID=A0A0N4X585_HAEPC|nr:unnamed protein product [Haemonchus placei]
MDSLILLCAGVLTYTCGESAGAAGILPIGSAESSHSSDWEVSGKRFGTASRKGSDEGSVQSAMSFSYKLIYVSRKYKMPSCHTLIDLKKAFNTVEVEAVIGALGNQSILTQYRVGGHVMRYSDDRWTGAATDCIPRDIQQPPGRPQCDGQTLHESADERNAEPRVPEARMTH